jgi:hypothetical protein
VLAEAAIREAAQVRNDPRDLINPVVALNRVVAITERDGPEHGLAALVAVVGMGRSQLWHAALAEGLAGPPKLPGSWKPPPRWRPPGESGGCFGLVSLR